VKVCVPVEEGALVLEGAWEAEAVRVASVGVALGVKEPRLDTVKVPVARPEAGPVAVAEAVGVGRWEGEWEAETVLVGVKVAESLGEGLALGEGEDEGEAPPPPAAPRLGLAVAQALRLGAALGVAARAGLEVGRLEGLPEAESPHTREGEADTLPV
jgi:hypothetical protein